MVCKYVAILINLLYSIVQLWLIHFIKTQTSAMTQVSAAAQALENVEMLVDVISIFLEMDDNEIPTFAVYGEFIGKQL